MTRELNYFFLFVAGTRRKKRAAGPASRIQASADGNPTSEKYKQKIKKTPLGQEKRVRGTRRRRKHIGQNWKGEITLGVRSLIQHFNLVNLFKFFRTVKEQLGFFYITPPPPIKC